MLKKNFIIFSILFFVFNLSFNLVSAEVSIGVKPLRTEMDLKPGDKKVFNLDIINNSNTSIVAVPVLETITKTDEMGYPVSTEHTGLPKNQDISQWITFKEQSVNVPSNSSKKVELQIDVPQDAEPGGHYAAIYYEPKVDNTKGVTIKGRVASLILVTVAGDVKKDGRLVTFDLDKKNIFGHPIHFKVLFENTGTVHLKPTGKIVIKDSNGNVVEKVGKYIDIATGKEDLLNYIPVNYNLGNVLPRTNRNFVSIWNENFLIEPGKYIAELELKYGDKNENKKIEFEIKPKISINKFEFIKEKDDIKKQFLLDIQNTGNIDLDLSNASLKVFNEMDYQVDEIKILDNTNTGKNILSVGQLLNTVVNWNKDIPEGNYRIVFDVGNNKLNIKGSKEYIIGNTASFFDKVLAGDITSIIILVLSLFVLILAVIMLFGNRKKSSNK